MRALGFFLILPLALSGCGVIGLKDDIVKEIRREFKVTREFADDAEVFMREDLDQFSEVAYATGKEFKRDIIFSKDLALDTARSVKKEVMINPFGRLSKEVKRDSQNIRHVLRDTAELTVSEMRLTPELARNALHELHRDTNIGFSGLRSTKVMLQEEVRNSSGIGYDIAREIRREIEAPRGFFRTLKEIDCPPH